MCSICNEPPTLIRDLKITVKDVSLVFPPQKSHTKSIFLSNIDRVLNFPVETVHFFPSHDDFPPPVVAEKLKRTLSELLVPYHFLAGRLRSNPDTGRLEIDCNSAGIGFVVASSDYELDDVGDLVYPNPAFGQLVCKSVDSLEQDNQPLCIVQVTSFKCGGFAMGVRTSHVTFDGLSFKIFLDNLAALAADKSLVVTPCNDRQLLAARSPSRVSFPHLELAKFHDSSPPVIDPTSEALDFKVFRLTSDDITNLKEKAKASGGAHGDARITGFNVVTALIWHCKALSWDEHDPDRVSTLLYAVNIRPRLIPPLPRSYSGNAVLTAYARATCKEIEEAPFAKLVELVTEGAKRMTDEYARSAIDWGEIYQGFPDGEFLVSSWWKLGFDEVDYPWGRPRYSCPVVFQRKDIILLFPDIDDNNGVNVLVSLPSKEMSKFDNLFRNYLP
ncbi:protein HEADING DATE 3A-like [Hibiscus syriacus]|uniref:Protein HEADING DATE 3A-like n=1 Tax=Hibiscus syriacus TaxID=106335 RepID=A0A6A2YCU1_HIBSY|nr:omega-hydroxypalmitate O-feruloyl transferase-like [Hibiscus syriacus]KAE8671017.1 protein HEADING DATE 3A-like [Hibiscus syriacus]